MENQKIKIYSELQYICVIENFIKDLFIKESLSRKFFCKIYISVCEAVNNAIIHGNQGIVEKEVELIFINNKSHYEFIITDEGNGFDFFSIPDPTDCCNISKESGRGIFIMKTYSDELIFEDKGSRVKLLFFKKSD
jgi:serine/threonine-protein kinase RsbW